MFNEAEKMDTQCIQTEGMRSLHIKRKTWTLKGRSSEEVTSLPAAGVSSTATATGPAVGPVWWWCWWQWQWCLWSSSGGSGGGSSGSGGVCGAFPGFLIPAAAATQPRAIWRRIRVENLSSNISSIVYAAYSMQGMGSGHSKRNALKFAHRAKGMY